MNEPWCSRVQSFPFSSPYLFDPRLSKFVVSESRAFDLSSVASTAAHSCQACFTGPLSHGCFPVAHLSYVS
ncbi:hypothetical protein AB0R12_36345 [Streptomyces niveus]|uniref:hypothetical protein n=1 Tax=Streptomyces niveus TaxID=193462 RepID=UPI00342F472B